MQLGLAGESEKDVMTEEAEDAKDAKADYR